MVLQMTRVHGWQRLFSDLVQTRRALPFVWGNHDCCLWAADSTLTLTGTDFAKDLRGTYSTATGAARVLEKLGGVQAIAEAALGPSVPPSYAALGDVVLINSAGRPALAVCGGQAILAVSEQGLEYLPMSEAVFAWKV